MKSGLVIVACVIVGDARATRKIEMQDSSGKCWYVTPGQFREHKPTEADTRYPMWTWREAVQRGVTSLGYKAWRQSQIVSEKKRDQQIEDMGEDA